MPTSQTRTLPPPAPAALPVVPPAGDLVPFFNLHEMSVDVAREVVAEDPASGWWLRGDDDESFGDDFGDDGAEDFEDDEELEDEELEEEELEELDEDEDLDDYDDEEDFDELDDFDEEEGEEDY